MTRPTFAKFKEKALGNSEVKKEYEDLAVAYDLRKKLINPFLARWFNPVSNLYFGGAKRLSGAYYFLLPRSGTRRFFSR